MTPEERFTKIENYLSAITEHQAEHEEQIRALRIEHEQLRLDAERAAADANVRIGRLADLQERTEERLLTLIEHIDGHEARIRRLEGR